MLKGTRLDKLQSDLNDILLTASKAQNQYMKSTLGTIVKDGYEDTIYEIYRGYGIGKQFEVLDPNIISQITRNPVNGQNFSSRVWNNRNALSNQVNQTMRAGISQGISNDEMAKRITEFARVPGATKSDMRKAFRVAKRLIDTEVTNSYNQSTKVGYENSGIVFQYEYVATLDDRTSDVCTELDGKIFDVDKAITGLNFPPVHVNCRSTTVAHFDDSKEGLTRIARDLGSNTFTVPATLDAKNFKAIYVEKTLTRDQWDKGKRI